MGKASLYNKKYDSGKTRGYSCLNCETKVGRDAWVNKGIRFCSVKCRKDYLKRGKQ